jgi:hypothetical protein
MVIMMMKVRLKNKQKLIYNKVTESNMNFFCIFKVEEEDKIKPWEENNGYYGILSRLVKQFSSTFIWTVKSGTIDYSFLSKDQIVNHYNKNGAFTTKVNKI